jgi:N-acetyl-anhydromuramyl-L-alanine amidase AmpD
MQYTDLLLEQSNTVVVDGETLGALITVTGKTALWSDRSGLPVDVTVLHYSSAVNRFPDDLFSLGKVLSIFCEYGVSSHFIIDREGGVFRLVPLEKKAWHCGGSVMPEPDNRQGVNDFSVGIELLATAESGFTDRQYAALLELCIANEEALGQAMRYVGHDAIAGERAVALGLRQDCKIDPGPLFDWRRFSETLLSCRKP